MQIIRTEKQKDNLAKFFWDMAKVAFTLLVIGPFAKPESLTVIGTTIGVAIGAALGLFGYLLDGMEVRT
jgi:ABC-type microcin C transport system permease subunit YejE